MYYTLQSIYVGNVITSGREHGGVVRGSGGAQWGNPPPMPNLPGEIFDNQCDVLASAHAMKYRGLISDELADQHNKSCSFVWVRRSLREHCMLDTFKR